jgi:hypothetical protein
VTLSGGTAASGAFKKEIYLIVTDGHSVAAVALIVVGLSLTWAERQEARRVLCQQSSLFRSALPIASR